MQLDDVDAVVEILTKVAVGYHIGKVSVCRRENPGIDGLLLR